MADTTAPTPPQETPEPDRDAVLRETYALAEKQLRANHLDEFNTIRAKLAEEKGVTWKPKLTKKEQAAATLAEILREHPDLVDQLPQANAKAPQGG